MIQRYELHTIVPKNKWKIVEYIAKKVECVWIVFVPIEVPTYS